MKKCLFILFTAFYPCYSQTLHNTQVAGVVRDFTTNKPISAVINLQKKWNIWHTTNEGFNISYSSMQKNDTLIVNAVGYETNCIYVGETNMQQNISIQMKPYLMGLNDSIYTKRLIEGREIIRKSIDFIPKNYHTESIYYDANYQEVIFYEQKEGILEKYDAKLIIADKGYKEDNINVKISLRSLQKNIDKEWDSARQRTFTIGNFYNNFYKSYDYDFIRGINSHNEYSKFSSNFLQSSSFFSKYNLILMGESKIEADSVYVIVGYLKTEFNKNSLNKMIDELEPQKANEQKNEIVQKMKYSSPNENVLDNSLNLSSMAKIHISKQDFAILKIEYKNEIVTQSVPAQLSKPIRGCYETTYKKIDGKYALSKIRCLDYTGRIGTLMQCVSYQELTTNKILHKKRVKNIMTNWVDRKLEIYNLSEIPLDKDEPYKFSPLKPYF